MNATRSCRGWRWRNIFKSLCSPACAIFSAKLSRSSQGDEIKGKIQIDRRSGWNDLRFLGGVGDFSIRWKVQRKNRPVEFDRSRGISLSCRNLGAFDRRWRCYANVWRLRGMQSVTKALEQISGMNFRQRNEVHSSYRYISQNKRSSPNWKITSNDKHLLLIYTWKRERLRIFIHMRIFIHSNSDYL